MNFHETPARRLVLLAPSSAHIPASFRRPATDWDRYWGLLHEMQRLRGRIYLQDGAIQPSHLVDGRHHSDLDDRSWHLLVMNSDNRICGCARFHEHPRNVTFTQLTAARCALANSPEWSKSLISSLKAELEFSQNADIPCVELGGWALSDEIRGTSEAIRVALATYAFWQMMGGAVSLSTVTRRHCASSILRRIGGKALTHEGNELPAYYDPHYDCQMEVLKFYSWAPNPRYAVWVNQIKQELSQIAIVARDSGHDDILPQGDWFPLLASAKNA